jgi:hypothetical protein
VFLTEWCWAQETSMALRRTELALSDMQQKHARLHQSYVALLAAPSARTEPLASPRGSLTRIASGSGSNTSPDAGRAPVEPADAQARMTPLLPVPTSPAPPPPSVMPASVSAAPAAAAIGDAMSPIIRSPDVAPDRFASPLLRRAPSPPVVAPAAPPPAHVAVPALRAVPPAPAPVARRAPSPPRGDAALSGRVSPSVAMVAAATSLALDAASALLPGSVRPTEDFGLAAGGGVRTLSPTASISSLSASPVSGSAARVSAQPSMAPFAGSSYQTAPVERTIAAPAVSSVYAPVASAAPAAAQEAEAQQDTGLSPAVSEAVPSSLMTQLQAQRQQLQQLELYQAHLGRLEAHQRSIYSGPPQPHPQGQQQHQLQHQQPLAQPQPSQPPPQPYYSHPPAPGGDAGSTLPSNTRPQISALTASFLAQSLSMSAPAAAAPSMVSRPPPAPAMSARPPLSSYPWTSDYDAPAADAARLSAGGEYATASPVSQPGAFLGSSGGSGGGGGGFGASYSSLSYTAPSGSAYLGSSGTTYSHPAALGSYSESTPGTDSSYLRQPYSGVQRVSPVGSSVSAYEPGLSAYAAPVQLQPAPVVDAGYAPYSVALSQPTGFSRSNHLPRSYGGSGYTGPTVAAASPAPAPALAPASVPSYPSYSAGSGSSLGSASSPWADTRAASVLDTAPTLASRPSGQPPPVSAGLGARPAPAVRAGPSWESGVGTRPWADAAGSSAVRPAPVAALSETPAALGLSLDDQALISRYLAPAAPAGLSSSSSAAVRSSGVADSRRAGTEAVRTQSLRALGEAEAHLRNMRSMQQ